MMVLVNKKGTIMKLNKKYIKNLSKDKKSLPLELTHNVAGGRIITTIEYPTTPRAVCVPIDPHTSLGCKA